MHQFISKIAESDTQAPLTFITASGLMIPNPVIPIPAFAVPYAAPIAKVETSLAECLSCFKITHRQARLGLT